MTTASVRDFARLTVLHHYPMEDVAGNIKAERSVRY